MNICYVEYKQHMQDISLVSFSDLYSCPGRKKLHEHCKEKIYSILIRDIGIEVK